MHKQIWTSIVSGNESITFTIIEELDRPNFAHAVEYQQH